LARCRQNNSIVVISSLCGLWAALCLFVLTTQAQSQDVAPDAKTESVCSSRDSNHVITVHV